MVHRWPVDLPQQRRRSPAAEVGLRQASPHHVAAAAEDPQEDEDRQLGQDRHDDDGQDQTPAVGPRRDRGQHGDRHADQRQEEDQQSAQVGRHAHARELSLHGDADHEAHHAEEEEPPRGDLPAGQEVGDEEAEHAADREDGRREEAHEKAIGRRAEPEQPDAGDLPHQPLERGLDVRWCGGAEVDVVREDPVRDGAARHRRNGGQVVGETGVADREHRACSPHRGAVAAARHGHPDAHGRHRTARLQTDRSTTCFVRPNSSTPGAPRLPADLGLGKCGPDLLHTASRTGEDNRLSVGASAAECLLEPMRAAYLHDPHGSINCDVVL